MDPLRLIVAMPLIVIGCALAAAGVVLLRRSLACTATATAREASGQGDHSSRRPIVLQFTTRDGRAVEIPPPGAAEYEAGEQLTVIYDPTYPEIAQVASPVRLWIAPAAMALAGAAVAIVGAVNLASAVR